MTRIQPECFIECWMSGVMVMPYAKPLPIKMLLPELSNTSVGGKHNRTICVFLIKLQSTTLAERLEARGLQTFKP